MLLLGRCHFVFCERFSFPLSFYLVQLARGDLRGSVSFHVLSASYSTVFLSLTSGLVRSIKYMNSVCGDPAVCTLFWCEAPRRSIMHATPASRPDLAPSVEVQPGAGFASPPHIVACRQNRGGTVFLCCSALVHATIRSSPSCCHQCPRHHHRHRTLYQQLPLHASSN